MNIEDARAAARFARVVENNNGAVKYKVYIPGHNGKRYEVLIRNETRVQKYIGGITVSVPVSTGECLLDIDKFGTPPACASTGTSGVCYHVLAALIAVANSNGLNISLCGDRADAQCIKNIYTSYDSKMWRFAQRNGYRYGWAVTWKNGKEGKNGTKV